MHKTSLHVCLCKCSRLRCADFEHVSVCFWETLKAHSTVLRPNLLYIWFESLRPDSLQINKKQTASSDIKSPRQK